ncbi:hypothetical protein PO883_28160 [Massilia sp. DJPM01]|uniref:hypothetical protein n=1 Tax=Massilia sp. DJPM01 TaxID=3024404 RepID=UPI00259E31BB|nr:hypothetical protein [Massilia sp. DJPM01]MDM5181062.1 hypothetical protein [Massilia sp. DJPM01]
MRLTALFFAGLCAAASGAHASSCTFQKIHWARTSAAGEILVGASFGTVRSLDRGKTWKDVVGKRVRADAGGAQESFVHASGDGVQYATRSTGQRRHLVRKDDAAAPWLPFALHYADSAAPFNAVLVGGQRHILYFIGGDEAQAGPVRPSALYRSNGGMVEKLVDLDTAGSKDAYPFFLGEDGSMAYAGPDKIWASFGAGAGWTRIEGQSLTKLPWTMCYKPAS